MLWKPINVTNPYILPKRNSLCHVRMAGDVSKIVFIYKLKKNVKLQTTLLKFGGVWILYLEILEFGFLSS